MSNKERLIANNAKIEEIRQTLKQKQISPTDMLQARVDQTNSCAYLFYYYGGTDLSFIKNLDTSNVTNMSYMFYSCSRLTTLDVSNLDTSKVTTMEYMFQYSSLLTELNLSNFDTSNVTKMANMFSQCEKLASLDVSNFNTSKVSSMSSMFSSCKALTELNLSSFNTSKNTSTFSMFSGCNVLKTIIGKIDMINVTNNTNMLVSCTNLEDVTLLNIKKSLTMGKDISYGTKLSNATLINTFKELWDLTGSTSQTLTLSTTSKENIANIYVKLVDVTDEMLAQDPYAGNKKPCVVCEPTDEGAMTLTEYAISKNWAIA